MRARAFALALSRPCARARGHLDLELVFNDVAEIFLVDEAVLVFIEPLEGCLQRLVPFLESPAGLRRMHVSVGLC